MAIAAISVDQLRVSAAVDDILQFISERRLDASVAANQLKVVDMARLVFSLLGAHPSEFTTSAQSSALVKLTRQMKQMITTLGGDVDGGKFDFKFAPDLLTRFAHITLTAGDMDSIMSSVQVPAASAVAAADETQLVAQELAVLEKYKNYSNHDLCLVVAAFDRKLDSTTADLKAALRSNRHYQERCQHLVSKVAEADRASSELVAKFCFRKGLRNCSRRGAYEMALAKNRDHRTASTSAGATVLLMAGDEARGGLTDKQIVIKHENYAQLAQRLRSHRRYREFDEQLVHVRDSNDDVAMPPRQLSFEVHGYKGDASITYIDREKIHVATIATTACGTEQLHRRRPYFRTF